MKVVVQENPKIYTPNNALDGFLEVPPREPDAIDRVRKQLQGQQYNRRQLVEVLIQYNQNVGNDPMALDNVRELMSQDKYCVVTGQQLGLLGGPSYTILKAISCLLLARELDAVPVFWLATDDHDISEIDHTYLVDDRGNIKEYRLHLPKTGIPVEELKLSANCFAVVEKFAKDIGMEEILDEIAEGDFYATAMTRLLCKLFTGTGLVFLEPRILRPLSIPFFQREITQVESIQKVLQDTLQHLEKVDSQSTSITVNAPNLFFKGKDLIRRRIHYQNDTFTIGDTNYTADELVSLIELSAQNFSTNVFSRPVLQSLLLPTLAYVAGPNELHYYHQLKEYHHFHGTVMPWVVPRLSATVIPPRAQDLLERCKRHPWENIPSHWHEWMPELDMGIADLLEEWGQVAYTYFQEELSQEVLMRHVKQSAMKLHKKITRKRLDRLGVPYSALHYLRNLLHPHHKPQERVLNWLGFQAESSENLVQACLESLKWNTDGHYYLYIR